MVAPNVMSILIRGAGFRSQRAFAEAIGLHHVKVCLILSGKRAVKSAEVGRMAVALRVPAQTVIAALPACIHGAEGRMTPKMRRMMRARHAAIAAAGGSVAAPRRGIAFDGLLVRATPAPFVAPDEQPAAQQLSRDREDAD